MPHKHWSIWWKIVLELGKDRLCELRINDISRHLSKISSFNSFTNFSIIVFLQNVIKLEV